MLHLVFDFSNKTILQRVQADSCVIFLNNAVLKLLKDSHFEDDLNALVKITPCYVLNDDLILRGLESDLILSGIDVIDYAKFVQLTIENTPIQTWT
jgi:tRNA 2-thiouridine synthesizing protein B